MACGLKQVNPRCFSGDPLSPSRNASSKKGLPERAPLSRSPHFDEKHASPQNNGTPSGPPTFLILNSR